MQAICKHKSSAKFESYTRGKTQLLEDVQKRESNCATRRLLNMRILMAKTHLRLIHSDVRFASSCMYVCVCPYRYVYAQSDAGLTFISTVAKNTSETSLTAMTTAFLYSLGKALPESKDQNSLYF